MESKKLPYLLVFWVATIEAILYGIIYLLIKLSVNTNNSFFGLFLGFFMLITIFFGSFFYSVLAIINLIQIVKGVKEEMWKYVLALILSLIGAGVHFWVLSGAWGQL